MLSILMPVYNELGTVEQAITEVLGTELQTDIELIVVDDGSTDGTRELLDSRDWPSQVTVLHHERNAGKGAAVENSAVAVLNSDEAAVLGPLQTLQGIYQVHQSAARSQVEDSQSASDAESQIPCRLATLFLVEQDEARTH